MELIMMLFLFLLGCLPAIIVTVIAFCINPVWGVALAVLCIATVVITSIFTIREIIKKEGKFL